MPQPVRQQQSLKRQVCVVHIVTIDWQRGLESMLISYLLQMASQYIAMRSIHNPKERLVPTLKEQKKLPLIL